MWGKAPKYYYFTIDALPSHVSEVRVQNTTSGYGSDSKGKFLVEGDVAEIRFFIDEGYSTWNSDVVVTKEQYDVDGETKASRFIITVRASVPTEKIKFFSNNP